MTAAKRTFRHWSFAFKLRSVLWLLATVLPLKVFAASLTTQQIIDLHSAGIGDAVIAQQVEANGINFDADAAALLTLKKAGLSDTVLGAVVRRAAAGATPSVAPATTSDPVSELYKAKKYPEVADLVMEKVRANSASDRERAILVLALLKLDNLSEAKVQANLLATQSPSSSYAPRLAAVLTQADEMRRLQGPVDDAIKRLSAKDLQSVIASSSLAESEKRNMLVDAAVLSADFDHARQLLIEATGLSYTEQNKRKIRKQKLQEQEQAFRAAFNDVDKIIYAPAAVSRCASEAAEGPASPATIGRSGFTVRAYLDAVGKLLSLAPLNSTVLDRAFHATIISAKYSDIEGAGDRILAARGQLGVPGYSSTRFVSLVIDTVGQQLRIEPDDHPFPVPTWKLASVENAVLATVPFAQITGLGQDAGLFFTGVGHVDGILSDHAYAVKLKPMGTFPQYALMAFLHCSFGRNAQQNATRNLGAFIQHVAKIDAKYVSLVEPKEDKKPGGTGAASVFAGVGMALGVTGSSEMLQSVQANQASIVEQQSRRNDLYSNGRFTFSVAESPSVQGLEGALSLTTDGPQ